MGKRTRQVWQGAMLLGIMVFLMAPSLTVFAQPSSGIGGRVANPDPTNPRSKSIFIYTLEHGASKQDQLLVVNPTDEEQTILLGSVDGVVTNTGDYTCRQEVEPVTGSGSWVELTTRQVIIPAGGEEKIDFTVTVPEQADVGEHNSCLTIQVEGNEGDEVSSGVRLRMRQAIRMITTIPGELRRDLSIAEFTVNQDSVSQVYTLAVANKGNVSADIDMRVRLTGLFGQEVADVGGEYPVVPGENLVKEFTTELQPMFGGWYEATPSLRYDKRLGAFGTQNEDAEYETITGASVTVFFWPTLTGWLVIAGVLVLLLGLIWRTTGRVKRQRALRTSAEKYTVRKADTIQTLAKKTKVTWQELAALNKLSAPYSLEVGQEILLPTLYVGHSKPKAARKRVTKKK